MSKSAIVIGAGIVGLAAARALAVRGYSVKVFEREQVAIGASIRNFGMVWPIGQPVGQLYDRAMCSRTIWKEIADAAGIWNNPCGSIQCANEPDEHAVLEEFYERYATERKCVLLRPEAALSQSPFLKKEGLKAALFSPDELIVDPREAIRKLPGYLAEQYGVEFHFGKMITGVQYPFATSHDERHYADRILVCSGPDFETLYPELFAAAGITKCKLQMMRTRPHANIGPAIAGGMTLGHYASFAFCESLKAVKARFASQYPEYGENGIHVMVSQNGNGELVIGDSHEYGLTHDPFISMRVNDLILNYLQTFTTLPGMELAETWHGIYPKLEKGTELVANPEEGVTIVNGLGGAGMSLSFGLLDEIVSEYV